MSPNPNLSQNASPRSRREFLRDVYTYFAGATALVACAPILGTGGCTGTVRGDQRSKPDLIVGQRGLADGRFQKPRALAIDSKDQLFVVDKTGRVQMFDADGRFIRGWRTPEIESGKPTGISIDVDGTVMVSDTHYYRFLFYSPDGQWLENRTIGGTNGPDPGQFAFVTDIVRAPNGNFYCGEYGEFDRIHKYSSDGEYIDRMGEHGDGPLQFSRPQSLTIDREGLLWVADACNHRIQVIDWREDKPRSVAIYGTQGTEPGQFQYPYGMILTNDGSMIVSEFGNHRVQHLDPQGKPIASWGSPGNAPGELNQPWATAMDSRNRIYVVDSGNNRIQRFRF
jgi:sugar lactone lactonase YvrE